MWRHAMTLCLLLVETTCAVAAENLALGSWNMLADGDYSAATGNKVSCRTGYHCYKRWEAYWAGVEDFEVCYLLAQMLTQAQ